MTQSMPHPKFRRPLATLILALGILTGCARATPEAFNTRMASLVGRSEADLVAALGVPERTYEAEGRRFLQYEDRRLVSYPGAAFYGPGYGGFGGRRFGSAFNGYYSGGFAPMVETRACDVTFELRAGRVAGFTARGNDCVATAPVATPVVR
jgi:hypothetical protein